MQKALGKKERSGIFSLFLENRKMKFSEIEKRLKIRSNMVSYHLSSMMKGGLIEKKGEFYMLTADAERYIPMFSADVNPLPVILVAIVHAKKILMIKRNKRPYKGYWSMIGGKLLLHEDIKDAAQRQVKDKTGLDARFMSINNVMHERIEGSKSGKIKHSFILIFVKVAVKSSSFKGSNAGELKWFDISRIDASGKEIIPSDLWLIKNSLDSKIKIPSLHMIDNEGSIESHKFL